MTLLNCFNCGAEFWTEHPVYFCNKCKNDPDRKRPNRADNSLVEEWT